jgi:hypothetical protein
MSTETTPARAKRQGRSVAGRPGRGIPSHTNTSHAAAQFVSDHGRDFISPAFEQEFASGGKNNPPHWAVFDAAFRRCRFVIFRYERY